MDLQGRIKVISATQSFGANGFQKREIVITTEEQYPQYIIFEFTQDKCALLDNFRLGQLVRISFNVRGREWVNPQGEARYFNSLQGWRIEDLENGQQYQQMPQNQQVTQMQPQTPPVNMQPTQVGEQQDFDDLPF